ncbi:MAG TPA: glycine cleavage T C-terminal barrel domain-containing protein [Actinocrinis sp.]|nr:glycine cleavage T C-terminal barrel domain-containing protein [Actinocrinis sp.]
MTVVSPLLGLHGAVAADSPDEAVAAHYGDPHREQRSLAQGRGFVDLSQRGVIRIGGKDRLGWLHSLLSQHLSELPPYTPTEALLLDPQGRIEHAMYIVDDGAATWMHVEPGEAPALVAFFTKMRFMMDVDPVDVTDDYALILVAGPDEPAALDGVLSRRVDLGREYFLPRARLAEFGPGRAAALAEPVGMWAYEALRIEAHRPRLGFETDERSIPHELGWLPTAVHLNKGCYRGQETVARVENLGHPPRRLVFLHLDGTPEHLPPHGSAVEYDGRPVGTVTSSARHYQLGLIALAVVKRNVPVDAELLADSVPAGQEVVVPPDTGATARERLRAVR